MKTYLTTPMHSLAWIIPLVLLILSSNALKNSNQMAQIQEQNPKQGKEAPLIVQKSADPSQITIDSLLSQFVIGMGIHSDAQSTMNNCVDLGSEFYNSFKAAIFSFAQQGTKQGILNIAKSIGTGGTSLRLCLTTHLMALGHISDFIFRFESLSHFVDSAQKQILKKIVQLSLTWASIQQNLRNQDYTRFAYDMGYLSKLFFNILPIDTSSSSQFLPKDDVSRVTDTSINLGDIYGPQIVLDTPSSWVLLTGTFIEAAHLIKIGDQYDDCVNNFSENINAFATMANLISGVQSTTVTVSGHEHSHPSVTGTFALANWLETVDPATNNCYDLSVETSYKWQMIVNQLMNDYLLIPNNLNNNKGAVTTEMTAVYSCSRTLEYLCLSHAFGALFYYTVSITGESL